MQHTITLPADVVVTSRGLEFEAKLETLNSETVLQLVLHGYAQKVGDAASGAAGLAVKDKFGDKAKPADHKTFLAGEEGKAAVAKHTRALIEKAIEGLAKNEWSQRGTGGAVSEETHVQRIVAKQALKGKLGGDSEAWKDFLASDKGTQSARLDEIWAKNAAKLEAAFKHEMQVRRAKKAAPKVDIEL